MTEIILYFLHSIIINGVGLLTKIYASAEIEDDWGFPNRNHYDWHVAG